MPDTSAGNERRRRWGPTASLVSISDTHDAPATRKYLPPRRARHWMAGDRWAPSRIDCSALHDLDALRPAANRTYRIYRSSPYPAARTFMSRTSRCDDSMARLRARYAGMSASRSPSLMIFLPSAVFILAAHADSSLPVSHRCRSSRNDCADGPRAAGYGFGAGVATGSGSCRSWYLPS